MKQINISLYVNKMLLWHSKCRVIINGGTLCWEDNVYTDYISDLKSIKLPNVDESSLSVLFLKLHITAKLY